MQRKLFIPSREGGLIAPQHIAVVNPDPCDPTVADGDALTAILVSGFAHHVSCGDLRRALGIRLRALPAGKAAKTVGAAS